jgi:flagellin
MALTVYTNIYSTIGQNNLTKANNALSTSIERLSSGMRINHAADDASGLAISEKLRGQIRGMAKASMNAQDAVSFLQTAEGGMEVIGDILQRMRELAVQAGNGAYTSNDRMELQKEVSQLKDEINRISSSTEFNTKKILTGEAAAIWSTSDPAKLEAIVRGTPAEGNYRVEVASFGGQNAIYKSDIMNTSGSATSAMAYDYTPSYQGGVSKASFSNVYGEVTEGFDVRVGAASATTTLPAIVAGTLTLDKNIGRLSTGVESNLDVDLTANATNSNAYYVLEAVNDGDFSMAGSVTGEDFKLTKYDLGTGARTDITTGVAIVSGNATWTVATGLNLDFKNVTQFAAGDKILFGAQGAVTGAGPKIQLNLSNGMVVDGLATAGAKNFAIAEMDESGNVSVGRGVVTVGTPSAASGGSVRIVPQITNKSLFTIDTAKSVATTADMGAAKVIGGVYPDGVELGVASVATTLAKSTAVAGKALSDANLNATAALTGAAVISTGSIVLEALNDVTNATFTDASSLSSSNFKATFIDAATGLEREIVVSSTATAGAAGAPNSMAVKIVTDGTAGSTVTFNTGDISKGDKVLVKQQAAVAAIATGATSANITMDGLTIQVAGNKLDDVSFNNVQMDNAGNVTRSLAKVSFTDNTAGTLVFGIPDAEVATLDTKLRDITRFSNSDGRMVLDNTQTLTLFANGKTLDMTMEGSDTVADFRSKLNQTLLDLGLGSGDPAIDDNLVRYVTEEDAQASGNLAVAGTFVFQAGIAGDASNVQFIGDQGVLNALSIAQIQDSQNSELDVTVSDAHTGALVGKDRIGDNVLRGVIEGIDVKINNPSLTTSYNRTTGKITFSAPAEPVKMDLHVVDNRTAVQIGANEGQTINISIAEMNTKALEIDNAYVTTFDESQKAITKFDQALAKVSGARATMGAQVNRLNYTMQNLAVSKMNLISAESRIRDLDVADESATFARNQVLVNTAIAMLAQANAMPQAALQLIG